MTKNIKNFVITAFMVDGQEIEIIRPCYESMLKVEKELKQDIAEGFCTGYQVEVK